MAKRTWNMVYGTAHMVCGMWHSAHGIWHLEAALELVEAVLPAQFLGQVLDVQRRARRRPVLLEG